MELYEYARPALMAGKKILYVHGFASSGQNGSVRTLRLLMPQATVLAPDLPAEPFEAMELLRNMITLAVTERHRSLSRKPFWSISGKSARIVSRGRPRIRTRSSDFTESTTLLSTLSTCSVSIILRR